MKEHVLRVGEASSEAWELFSSRYGQYFKLLLLLLAGFALVSVTSTVLLFLLGFHVGRLGPDAHLARQAAVSIGAVVSGMVTGLYTLLAVSAVYLLFWESGPGRLWKLAATRTVKEAWGLIVTNLLQTLVTFGALPLLAVGSAVVGTRVNFAMNVFLDGGGSGLRALQGSNAIVKGSGWRVFLIVFLPFLLIESVPPAFGLVSQGPTRMIVHLLWTVFSWMVAIPFLLCLDLVAYRKLRARESEGAPDALDHRSTLIGFALVGVLVLVAIWFVMTRLS